MLSIIGFITKRILLVAEIEFEVDDVFLEFGALVIILVMLL